ncbi:hypothetical protein H696_04520 [Fonticula alba]|uniref:Lysophospholipid acyltransferase n=1 Tax=Fonticula alba TaxID=691883 RepID=A0A058Z495_FONAL|nr:hypothetical protein H696_04520 [Fonticula alba]KCV69104.1 hypothetical protein H696_04520 [Fonticula alba]|eukprot:XP_009496675.1 hypothetical protein H696_04520 [Fonticula alba]
MWDTLVHYTEAYVTTVQAMAEPFTPPPVLYVQRILSKYADTIGVPTDQLSFLLAAAGTLFVVGPITRFLPGPPLVRSLWGALTGLFFCLLVIGSNWAHVAISAFVSYAMMWLLPISIMPYAVFLFELFYTSLGHIHRMAVSSAPLIMDITDGSSSAAATVPTAFDFSAPQMILIIRMTSLAWSIYDGHRVRVFNAALAEWKVRFARDASTPEALAARAKIDRMEPSPSQVVRALPSPPNVLHFLGFILHPASSFCGPAFDYHEYIQSISFAKVRPDGSPAPTVNYLRALRQMAVALFFGGLFFIGDKYAPVADLYRPELAQQGILYRIGLLYSSLLVQRSKYYFAWLLAEACCLVSGFGYYAKGTEERWDGVENANVGEFELGTSIRGLSVGWNKFTSKWLRTSVYDRVPPAWGLAATYIVSASWHGFYAGYYLFFFSAGFMQVINREFRRKIRPRIITPGSTPTTQLLYDIFTWAASLLAVSYLAASFVGLTLEAGLTVWSHFGYMGHYLSLVIWVVLKLIPPPPRTAAAPGGPKKPVAAAAAAADLTTPSMAKAATIKAD